MPSSHPAAFAWSPDEKTLYVALANRDAVAAMRVGGDELKLEALFDTRLPGQTYFGAMPDAVAVSEDGRRLFAANTGSDAIAVFALRGGNLADQAGGVGTDRVVSHRLGGQGQQALRRDCQRARARVPTICRSRRSPARPRQSMQTQPTLPLFCMVRSPPSTYPKSMPSASS